jgi:hypothetical protein
MKNGVFWDVTPCGSCKNRRGVSRLLVTANDAPSSLILVTRTMNALCSSETSVLTRATRRNIPEGAKHLPVHVSVYVRPSVCVSGLSFLANWTDLVSPGWILRYEVHKVTLLSRLMSHNVLSI